MANVKHDRLNRRDIMLATFNCRTLKDPVRRVDLVGLCAQVRVDVLAIQEHRISTDSADITTEVQCGGFFLHLLSAVPPLSTGGIGILLSPRFQKAMTNVRKISERILHATFAFKRDQRKVHVIACYSPTAAHPDQSVAFYQQLQAFIWLLPRRDMVMVLGDLNASLPTTWRAPWACGTPNANADLLLDLLNATNMVSGNSWCKKKRSHRETFRVRLDHVLIPWRWRQNIRDTRIIFPSLVQSDHGLVCCKVRIADQIYKPPRDNQKRLQWFNLRDKKVRTEFSHQLQQRLQGRRVDFPKLVKAAWNTALDCLPKMPARKPPVFPWEADPRVREARSALLKCKRENAGKANLSPTDASTEAALHEEYVSRVDRFLLEETNAAVKGDVMNGVRIAWRCIQKLTGKKKGSSLQLPGDSQEERLRSARDYFEQLLSPATVPTSAAASPYVPPTVIPKATETDFVTGPATFQEVSKAAWGLAAGKAPGPDGLPVECYRVGQVVWQLTHIINEILVNTAAAPTAWGEATIVPVPKKPAARSLDQHRGISLMNIAPKVFSRLLLNRLQPVLDPLLLKEQNGFRKGRSTIHHVTALRRIIEESTEHRQELHLVFVDFRKAFDSVTRGLIPTVLEAYGVPPALVYAVCAMYEHTFASVKTTDGLTARFETTAGVLQGDVLAPFIFILCLDLALRAAIPDDDEGFQLERCRSSRHPGKRISVMAYADDLVLISSTRRGAQKMLTALEDAGAPFGLVVSDEKTRSLSVNSTDNTPLQTRSGVIQQCQSFLYLGCMVPDVDAEVKRRKALSWAAMGKLQPVWSSPASVFAKARLFERMIEPILLYGAESWSLSATGESVLDGIHARLLRAATGLSWPAPTTTMQLYKMTNKQRVSREIRAKRRRLLVIVKTEKATHLQPLNDVLLWCPAVHTGRVSHRKGNFLAVVERDAGKERLSLQEYSTTLPT
jgi:exonuclease III